MKQEDKQLLFKDLCARLPYHDLQVRYDNKDWFVIGYGHERIELLPNPFSSITSPCPLIEDVKLYLRPMSSMTEEEENEYNSLNAYEKGIFPHTEEAFDWLNAHHFDYRRLIEKGLALEAPEGMHKF